MLRGVAVRHDLDRVVSELAEEGIWAREEVDIGIDIRNGFEIRFAVEAIPGDARGRCPAVFELGPISSHFRKPWVMLLKVSYRDRGEAGQLEPLEHLIGSIVHAKGAQLCARLHFLE